MSNFGLPLQTHSFTSSGLLHHRAQAGLPAQTALETGQHRCTKQIEYSNATTSPSLQLQRLSTKGMTLQLELKVRSRETPRNMSLSNLLWKVAGRNNDFINRNDKADDGLPLIEETLGQISHRGISTGRDWNAKASLQDLDKLALDTSRSCIGPEQSRLDNSAGDSQGTRGMCGGSPSL